MKRAGRILLLAVLVAGVATCGKSSTGPTAGTVKVQLTTPNTGDGAIVLSVTGPAALTSATAGGGVRVFAQPLGTTTKFALTGTLTTGVTILTVGITDVSQAGSYSATVLQVAASTFQLRNLAGYSLTVSK